MNFKDPWILFLTALIVAGIFWYHRRSKPPVLRFSSLSLFQGGRLTWRNHLSELPFWIRCMLLVLFGIALAGPRLVNQETEIQAEGIDIVLAIDASGSMAGEDFVINQKRMNRLAIVKEVVKEFIAGRHADRIGLVAFGGEAYTVCPLTTDYNWLITNLERVELGIIADGTAVGSAIASATARLKNSTAKSKVIILLTDGINNAGKIDPLTAAGAAGTLGIKIYTIGAGTKGYVPFPVKDFFGRTMYQKVLIDIDEKTLSEIAKVTSGQYFRATDTESLRQIYKEIDLMEKVRIEEKGYVEYTQLFGYVLLAALILLLVEILLSRTVLLKIP